MIDAEDVRLVETAQQDGVELARGSEVPAEGLLDDHPSALGAVRSRELLDDRFE
jgi:hypothetical protein